jgi:hypothetical protein
MQIGFGLAVYWNKNFENLNWKTGLECFEIIKNFESIIKTYTLQFA